MIGKKVIKLVGVTLILFCFIFVLPINGWADEVLKITEAANIEDTYLESDAPDYNFGSRNELQIAVWVSEHWYSLIRVQNLATLLPAYAHITICACSLYCYDNQVDGTISAYEVFKTRWIEGTQNAAICADSGASWNDWNCTALEWAVAGCGAAYDTGHDNSGDGVNSDRKATAEGSMNVTTVDTWYGFTVSNALAQGWYDGTIAENGVILIDPTGYNGFRSTEHADPALRPFWTITYTIVIPPEKKILFKR